jgi:hypothetical protein
MDYKLLYECEMKRADKAEDELAALRAQLDKAHFQIATLGYVAGCDTTSGGPPPDYEAAREAILSLSRELDAEWETNEQMEIELAAMRAQVAELEAANEWRPVTEMPQDKGEYLGWDEYRVQIVTYDPDLDYEDSWAWGDWYDDPIPVTHWRPLPPAPLDSTQSNDLHGR